MHRLLLGFLALLLLTNIGQAQGRPHIIWILTDDLGPGDVGCFGGTLATTPNIDRMAREGTRFTRYYSASPICSPSRCGLITGQFPARWKITSYLQTREGNRQCEQVDFLDPRAPTLPRILHKAGYATAHIGKWHLGGGRDVVDAPRFAAYGWDLGLGTYESPEPAAALGIHSTPWARDREPQQVARHDRTRWMIDQTIQFIQTHSQQPCFVNLWLDDPHTPWVPDEAAAVKTDRDKLKAVLEENDRQIGRLLDGVPANTLIFYASDNGPLPNWEQTRSLGLRGSKLSLYEGGIRLPLVARWPGLVPTGRVDDTTVITAVDILPTLARIAQAELPPDYAGDGQDLSDAILRQPVVRSKPIFWEYGRNDQSFVYPKGKHRSPNVAMRDGPWKLLIDADGSDLELYDVVADPNEEHEVAAAHPEIAARMKEQALSWRKSLPAGPVASSP